MANTADVRVCVRIDTTEKVVIVPGTTTLKEIFTKAGFSINNGSYQFYVNASLIDSKSGALNTQIGAYVAAGSDGDIDLVGILKSTSNK